MAFKTFTAGSVLTAAEVNDYLMKQAVIVCTSATRPGSPVEGMTIYETDTDKLLIYTGSAWGEMGTTAAWPTWTPTLTQSGGVTKTVTHASYTRDGRLVTAVLSLAATGSGTGSNRITVSLPVTAAASNLICGSFRFYDLSANVHYTGVSWLSSTTLAAFLGGFNAAPGFMGEAASGFSAAIASGDGIDAILQYQAA